MEEVENLNARDEELFVSWEKHPEPVWRRIPVAQRRRRHPDAIGERHAHSPAKFRDTQTLCAMLTYKQVRFSLWMTSKLLCVMCKSFFKIFECSFG
jgi:hypothetical protein